jgi:hypothetical protein
MYRHTYEEDDDPVDQSEYQSLTMSLLYAAKRTRPDILKSVIEATRKLQNPTVKDQQLLLQVLRYLYGTKDLKMTFQCTDLSIHVHADSSFLTHADGKSHTGGKITLGPHNAPVVISISSKQSLVTLSSSGAELVAFHSMFMHGLYVYNLLIDLGLEVPVILGLQDNKATIRFIENGEPINLKSKHINARFFHAFDYIRNGKLWIQYVPTHEMEADVLTKDLPKKSFIIGRKMLLNHI